MANPQVVGQFHEGTNTITYIVWDTATKDAAIVDPVLDFEPADGRIWTAAADRALATVKEHGLKVRYILETHAHADHLSSSQYLKRQTGAKVVIGSRICEVQRTFVPVFAAADVTPDGGAFDVLFSEGDSLPLGTLTVTGLATPGHTPACVTYVVGDAAFCGDTIFMPDYGSARCDFPGGSAATLWTSIRTKLYSLPPATRLFVGHDYKPAGSSRGFEWETTVGAQRERNVHIKDAAVEAEFVAMRQARDATLGAPRLLLPSLQVNIRAGHLPPADADGSVRLRVPVKVGGELAELLRP